MTIGWGNEGSRESAPRTVTSCSLLSSMCIAGAGTGSGVGDEPRPSSGDCGRLAGGGLEGGLLTLVSFVTLFFLAMRLRAYKVVVKIIHLVFSGGREESCRIERTRRC